MMSYVAKEVSVVGAREVLGGVSRGPCELYGMWGCGFILVV